MERYNDKTDLCYFRITVSESGGDTLDVSRRIQEARGACQSTHMNREIQRYKFLMFVLNVCFYMVVRPLWLQMS